MREYIITDQIVNKAIQAIDNENKENDSLDMMLVGGMAVQAHINEKNCIEVQTI
ncbi:MAG: hypothetical protein MUP58_01795 [Candidatus Nanohaloarchaeota archaeon QJJ-9]|nr:hypothetical protein [Candidatus Nanohaloarchaeota archaeon QJJ-9]